MSEALLFVTAAMAFVSVALLTVWVVGERRARVGLGVFRDDAGQDPAGANYHRLEPESWSGNKVEEAVTCFKQGCPCSRVLLATYGPAFGLTRGEALEAGMWFAKDMRAAETCGGVTAAFTLLARRFPGCDPSTPDGRAAARAAFGQFSAQFKAKHGTLTCREALRRGRRNRLTQPEREAELKRKVCPQLVHDAAQILEKMLKAPPSAGVDGQFNRLAA